VIGDTLAGQSTGNPVSDSEHRRLP
jgi:hypothetical protein